jgi:2-dehydropantoate 2-reductase
MEAVILGAGGVGGYLGARLIEGGAEVSFLVRGERAGQLARDGLIVKSPAGDFTGPGRLLTEEELATAYPDVVVLACKEPALAGALEAVTPLLRPGTRLLPLLNGVRHLETIAARFPQTPVLGGLVHGAADLRSDGTIEHLTEFMTVIVGAVDAPADDVGEAIVATWRAGGVDAHATHEIRQDMWNKFAFLAAFAGITSLMRASIGTILATDGGRERITGLLEETRSVAIAEAYPPPEALMAEYRELLTEEGSPLTSSMLRDIRAGRPTEGAHILGDMLARARRHGLATPLLAIAAAHVDAYERQRAAVCE